jgi:ABC-type phosphate/phosphonate transport system substrate-binding protein
MTTHMQKIGYGLIGLMALASGSAQADKGNSKVAMQIPNSVVSPGVNIKDDNELIFSAAPRESNAAEALEIYGPVAEYLSKVLNKKVSFKYPGTWGVYQGQMQKGGYDIVFDGPHFNSWRTSNLQHNVIVKVPGEHVFVTFVRKDNDKVKEMKQVAGRTFCAHAPPNLATLATLDAFDNPARQPVILNTKGWDEIYEGVTKGKCVVGTIPARKLEEFEKAGNKVRVIHRTRVMPDNAFSAGPRLNAAEQRKIAEALTSKDGEEATRKLRETYAGKKSFVATSNQEYTGLAVYLRNEWGY